MEQNENEIWDFFSGEKNKKFLFLFVNPFSRKTWTFNSYRRIEREISVKPVPVDF